MVFYFLIVLVLASFVIAFFSAKTWHWGYVLVVEFLFLATAGFFILAAETLRINAVLGTQVKKAEKELAVVEAQNNGLRSGTADSSIIAQLANMDPPVKTSKNSEGNDVIESPANLDHELLIATRLRGRVWRNFRLTPIQTGNVTLSAAPPATLAGIKKETVVYLFEDPKPAADGTQKGAQYLGEFGVVQEGLQQATLQPVLPMDNFERQRLVQSRGPWILYETMPLDRHEIFAGKSDDELKKWLSAKSVNEYIRDGKPATADDDPARTIGFDENGKRLPPGDLSKATKKIYQRRLHDYASEFDELIRRRIVMLADRDAVNKDNERLTTAKKEADNLQKYREDERQKLNSDLTNIKKEHAAIEHHVGQINKQLTRAHTLTAELARSNDQLTSLLAARQTPSRSPVNGAAPPGPSDFPLTPPRNGR